MVGRFQPFHCGHERLVREALVACSDVVVAVGSSQAHGTWRDPFTLDERRAMLEAVFDGLPVVPVPDLGDPDRWVAHLEAIVGPFGSVYGNDDATLDLFRRAGHDVVAPGLHRRDRFEASSIRSRMAAGDPSWRQDVPAPVASLLEAWDGPARLRRLEKTP